MLNSRTYYGTDGILAFSDADPEALEPDVFTSYFGENGTVGRVTNVTLYTRMEIKPFHEIGSRLPSELRAGNITIEGTIERAYINGAMLRLMLGAYSQNPEAAITKIPTFNMKLAIDNLTAIIDAEGISTLTVFGVMFDSWQILFPEDDFVMEKLTFKAQRLAVADSEISS